MDNQNRFHVSLQSELRAVSPSVLVNWHGLIVVLCTVLLVALAPYRFPAVPRWTWGIAGLLIWMLVIRALAASADFASHIVIPRLDKRFSKIELRDKQLRFRLSEARTGYLRAADALIRTRRHFSPLNWQRAATCTDEWINSVCDLLIRVDVCKRRFIAMSDDHSLAFDIGRMESMLKRTTDDATRKRIELALEEKERRHSFLHDYGLGVFTAEAQLERIGILMTTIDIQITTQVNPESDVINHVLNDIVKHTEALRESYVYLEAVCYGDYALVRQPPMPDIFTQPI